MEHPTVKTEVEWHRLIDGDPHHTGWYIVAHRGTAKLVVFNKAPYPGYNGKGPNAPGWRENVKWATHWALAPMAPDDGTPQLFRPEGQRAAEDIAYEKALLASEEATKNLILEGRNLPNYNSVGFPSSMWEK